MSAGKETPRQRMISMMYLVLTALLAMNVSREVLDAFVVVNESVVRSNYSFSQKIHASYQDFDRQYQVNQSKVFPFWTKSQEAQKRSRDMVAYVEETKAELIAFTENIPLDSAYHVPIGILTKLDDNIRPTNFFMGPSETGSDGKAGELKKQLEAYKAEMLGLIPEQYHDKFSSILQLDGDFYDPEGQKEPWALHYFYDCILAADITLLNKIITEVYTIEFDVVNLLINLISADDFKYDMISAKVIPKSQYLVEGQDYEAEIIVAAYDTTDMPDVYVLGGVDSLALEDLYKAQKVNNFPGSTQIRFSNSPVGTNKYAGIVRVRKGEGDYNNYHFNGRYTVARPSFSISPRKMNVLYAGVDNPISISVSGIAPGEIIPTISAGTIKYFPQSKEWIARVPSHVPEAMISIQATVDGSMQRMGSSRFRVKQVPVPKALIANRYKGLISSEVIIAAGGLEVKFPNDFEFYYPYRIESFEMQMQRGFKAYSYTSGSDKLSQEMIANLRKTNRGQKIQFTQIKAIGPNNEEEVLADIVVTIN